MSKVEIDPVCHRRLRPQWHARNGQLVSAQFQSDLAALANQIARYRGKTYFRSGGDTTGPITSKLWRWAGHIGPMAGSMIVRIYTAHASQVTQTHNPRVQLALYDTSGNLLKSGFAYYGYSYGKTPDEVPREWGVATIGLDVSDITDTAFRAQLIASDSARPISCVAYESTLQPSTENGYLNQSFSVGQSILDEDRSRIVDLANSLYKRGGPSVFTFSSQTDALAPEFLTVGYEPVGATLAGLAQVDLRFSRRKTVSTIPVKIECYAGMLVAGSGNVRVVDLDGNVYATFAISGAAAWQTPQTANLPADQRTYRIDCNSDGANIMRLYALSCFRYQS